MKYKIFIISILCSLCISSTQAQWTSVFNVPAGSQVHPEFCIGNHVLLTNDNGIYLSTDNGKTWKLADSSSAMQLCFKIISKDSLLLAITEYGVYTSLDSGQTWKAPKSWPYSDQLNDIIISGGNLIGALDASEKIVISKDYGSTWDTAQKGLPKVPYYHGYINALGVIGNKTLVFYAGDLYVSNDYGNSWQYKATGCPVNWPLNFHNEIFAPAFSGGIVESKDSGLTWKNVFASKQGADGVMGICTDGKILIAAVYYEGVIFSTDNGNTWIFKNDGLKTYKIEGVKMNSSYVFAGAYNGQLYRRSLTEFTGLAEDHANNKNDLSLYALKVYPNPLSNYTTFEFGRALKYGSICIYDMNGKEINSFSDLNEEKYVLQSQNIASGTYIYFITEGGRKLATGKLQINH